MDNGFLESLFINKSKVAGNGMFCSRDISKGDVVAPFAFEYNYDGNDLTIHDKCYLRSDVCRFTNHGYPSNCDIKKNGDILYLVSSSNIPSSEEISVDYFDVIGQMRPYPDHLPYIKKEVIRLLPSFDSDLFVNKNKKDSTYIDDLLDFSLKNQGCPKRIDCFYELLKRLKIG